MLGEIGAVFDFSVLKPLTKLFSDDIYMERYTGLASGYGGQQGPSPIVAEFTDRGEYMQLR